MTYRLVGKVWWSVGSCHDDRYLKINRQFQATDLDWAIKKAKRFAQYYYRRYGWHTDFGMEAKLLNNKGKQAWKVRFIDEEPSRPYVAAQPAKPAIKAHLEAKKLSESP